MAIDTPDPAEEPIDGADLPDDTKNGDATDEPVEGDAAGDEEEDAS